MRVIITILIAFIFFNASAQTGNSPLITAHDKYTFYNNPINAFDNYWRAAMQRLNAWDITASDSFFAAPGNMSARFELRRTDSTITPGHDRSEYQDKSDTAFYGYTYTILQTVYDPAWQGNDLTPFVIFQSQTTAPYGSPHLGLLVYNGKLYVGQNVYHQDPVTGKPVAFINRAWIVGNWTANTRYDFLWQFKWRNNSTGYFRLYINGIIARGIPAQPSWGPALPGGVTVDMNITGENFSSTSTGAMWLRPINQMGIYKWQNKNPSYPQFPTKTVVYMDNQRILDSTITDITPYFYKYNPIVNAGADITATQPVTSVHLTSSVTGGTAPYTYFWTKLGGPTGGTILSPTVSQTDIQTLNVGSYQYQILVTDAAGKTGKDTVQVTINQAANIPPVANAGNDTTITLPANSVFLNATLSTDEGTIISYLWTKLSGPASGTITNSAIASTTATGLVQGTYVFSVRVTDNNGAINTDTKQVTVLPAIPPPNQPPVANAGSNTTITLPTNTAPLNASASTDPDGTIVAYFWTKISGPAATVLNPTTPIASAIGLVAGDYVFRVRVTDNNGDTGIATKLVTVNPAIIPPLVASLTGTNILCYGALTGAITSSVSGGLPPYGYQWSNAATTSGISSVAAGGYNVRISDANNSVRTLSITLTQPDTVIANASFGTISVPSGTTTVIVSATGGKPPYAGTGTFTLQDTGSHTYPVTDANGCVTNLTIFIPLTPTPMSLTLTPTNPLCSGLSTGSIATNVSGGVAPYISFIWDNDYGLLGPDMDSTTQNLSNIPAGTYGVTIHDSNGDSIRATATVQNPPLLSIYESHASIQYTGGNTTVTITANGGTGAITGTGSFVVTAGTYTYTVRDANNCTARITVTITEGAQRPIPKKYKIRKQ